MPKARQAVLELAGREVVITNPDKPFFPQAGHTKLHLVRYYAAVADGALRRITGRPIVLKRYVDGAASEPFFQKRAPEQRPVDRDGGAALSVGADGARDRRARGGAASVDGEPRVHRLESAPGARRRPRAFRRVARRSRPRPGRELGLCAAGDAARARGSRRARVARLAQDLRLARYARQRAYPAALEFRAGATRGAGPRA